MQAPRDRRAPHRAGFSLLETLVVLTIIAVLLGLGVAQGRPSLEMRAARAVRSLILHARTEAIWSGTPVAVVDHGAGFSAGRATGPDLCHPDTARASVRLADFPGVRLETGIRSGGMYWLPSGSGRSCSGGGVISGTILLAGPRSSAAVIVSSLGRVRLEPRP